MKKILLIVLGAILSINIFAHAPLISVDDNGDGTIYIEGGFSNGASVAGVPCIIVKDRAYNGPNDTFNGKEIIYKGEFDKNNVLIIPKPRTKKYEVYLVAGEGHEIGKKGPKLEKDEMDMWKKAVDNYKNYGDFKEAMTSK